MIKLELKDIRYKLINCDELKLHLDRLTRFKHPKFAYSRVFKEIIFKNLTSPQLSAKVLEMLDIKVVVELVETIWNASVGDIPQNDGLFVNKILYDEAEQTFLLDEDSKIYLGAKLCLNKLLNAMVSPDEINLKRLKKLIEHKTIAPKELRIAHKLRFPLEKVILVEGITEDILLPKLAAIFGYDFNSNGIKVVGAGGKNQVAKLYLRFLEEVKIPIFVLLDSDGAQTASIVERAKRSEDEVYIIESGEFEDIIPIHSIQKTFSTFYKNINLVHPTELNEGAPMVEQLESLYKLKGFGEFKKAVFAKQLNEVIETKNDLSGEIIVIMQAIKNL